MSQSGGADILAAVRRRFAYLHVPKAAGRAVTGALHAVTGDRAVAQYGMGRTLFGDFEQFAALGDGQRAQVHLGDDTELHAHDAVIGHFALPTLRAAFENEDIAMSLREPRSRLLSLYTYWRGWMPERHAAWAPYAASQTAVDCTWPEFLEHPSIAAQTDNVVLRLLLGPHELIPSNGFIAAEHLDQLADEAIAAAAALGHIDVIEDGSACWARLGSWLGTPLEVGSANTTIDAAGLSTDWSSWFPAATSALTARTAGDAAVWRWAAARHATERAGIDSIATFEDATFARQRERVAPELSWLGKLAKRFRPT